MLTETEFALLVFFFAVVPYGLVLCFVYFQAPDVQKKEKLSRRIVFRQFLRFSKLFIPSSFIFMLLCSLLHMVSLHFMTFSLPTSLGATVSNLIIEDHAPPTWFRHFNPSMVALPSNVTMPGSRSSSKEGHYLVAMREGSLHNCPNALTWMNVLRFLHVDSRVIFAVSDRDNKGFRMCGALKASAKTQGTLYQGIDDPRLFLHKKSENDTGELMATLVMNNRLYISRLEISDNNNICDVKELSRKRLIVPGLDNNRKEKNWMHLPIPNRNPIFLRDMQTMHVVEVDPATGISTTISSKPFVESGLPSLRGSTNFIQHPRDPNKFLGIVHSKQTRYPPIIISFFKLRFVEVTRNPSDNSFSLTGLSEEFIMPPKTNAERAGRIEYPMSWMLNENSDVQEVIISMGHMDCESRVVKLPLNVVIRSIHPNN